MTKTRLPYRYFEKDSLARWRVTEALGRMPTRLYSGVEFFPEAGEVEISINANTAEEVFAFDLEFMTKFSEVTNPHGNREWTDYIIS